jgi:hypothetical protein
LKSIGDGGKGREEVSVRSRPPAFWGPGVAHYPG